MTDLMDRLDEMGQRARDRAAMPTVGDVVARSARRHRTRRRTSALAVAAAVTAIAVVGGVLVALSRHHTRVTTTDQQHVAGPHLVPATWPSNLDGPTTATSSHAWDDQPLPQWVLANDGRAAVTAAISSSPVQPPAIPLAPPTVEKVTVGESGGWAWTDGDDERLEVGIHPGWTLDLSSRVTDRSTLEQLAAAFDPANDRFSNSELPPRWTIAKNPFGLAAVISGVGMIGPGFDTARRTNQDERPTSTSLSVSSHWTDDATAIVASMRELFGLTDKSDGTIPGSVDLGLGGVLRATADGNWFVVWAPSQRVIALAEATTIGHDDLLASLRSVRAISDEDWTRIETAQPLLVDGFALRADEKVVQHGTIDGNPWMVTTSPPPATPPLPNGFTPDPAQLTMVNFHLRTPDGTQTAGGSNISSSGHGYTRGNRFDVVDFGMPVGIRDPQIHFEGRDVPTVAVPLPTFDATYVFGVLPARDTDDPAKATITATLADGSTYTSPRPSGG
jgi:hypothetical protein